MSDKEIQIRIAAKNLTDAELAKAKASIQGFATGVKQAGAETSGLGSIVKGIGPLVGSAFTIGAVVSFGKVLLDDADALVKLSDKTGIGIEALQRMKYTAEQSGNTLDQVTSAVSQLQRRMAGGNDSAANALQTLGLSFNQLKGLSPDAQFRAIAAEVAKIEDPAMRVKVATELFGKAGADVLPTLIADHKKLGDEASVMSEKATKAFDTIGDAMGRTWSKSKQLVGEGLGSMIDAFFRLGSTIKNVATGDLSGAADALLDLNAGALPAAQGLHGVTVAATGVAVEMDEADKIARELDETLKKKNETLKKAADEYKKVKAAQDAMSGRAQINETAALVTTYQQLQSQGLTPTREAMDQLTTSIERSMAIAKETGQTIPEAWSRIWVATARLSEPTADWADTLDQVLRSARPLGPEVLDTSKAWISGFDKMIAKSEALADGTAAVKAKMGDFAVSLPPAIKSTGLVGQAMDEAAKAAKERLTKGLGMAGDAFDGISRVAEMSGHKTTAAVASIASTTIKAFASGGPMAGAIAGITALFSAFSDKLLKVEGRKVNDLRDDFIAAAGGLHALNVKAHDAGLTLDRLLRASNVKDYEAAVAELNTAFEKQNAILEEQKRLQDEIKGIEGQIEDLRKQQLPTWDKMKSAADKYGVSLDTLGTKAQQLRIDEEARALLDAFDTMKDGGTDVSAILVGMQDEIQQLVLDSRKFGAAIPENMRPLIEQLIREKKLLDENGQIMTDTGQLKWGAAVKTQAEIIADSIKGLEATLKTLADALAKLVPGAAKSGFKEAGVDAGHLRDTLEDIFQRRWKLKIDLDDDGGGGRGGEMGHAAGGVFSTPHRAWIAEGGQPEIIGSVGFMERALAGAMRRLSGPAAVTGGAVTIVVQSILDGRKVAENTARHLPGVLALQGVR